MKILGLEFGKKTGGDYRLPSSGYEMTYNHTSDIMPDEQFSAPTNHTISVDDLPNMSASAMSSARGFAPAVSSIFTGDKFDGGFGVTELFTMDMWTLRERSEQLFWENIYAEGLINRLVTNEINIGLSPDVCPDSTILNINEDELNEWSELVENRFAIWSKNAELCDAKGKDTFGALQRLIKMKALVSGDVLVTLQQNKRTKLPMISVIDGSRVRSPFIGGTKRGDIADGNTVTHGVERNKQGRVVAYWVQNTIIDGGDFEYKRIVAKSGRTGRRNAWLVFGTEKLVDQVRGMPMLAIVLQSLKEIDRYRDSTQRKAVVNSLLAMFIKKTDDKMGSLPITGAATRVDEVQYNTSSSDSASSKSIEVTSNLPGMVAQELQTGEEPVLLGGQGTDVNFATFEESIISAYAWAKEIPPEILKLSFSSNYSASQAAINEFKAYLRKSWSISGDTLLTPIYKEVLISEVLTGKMSAPGLKEAWRDPNQYDILGAWMSVMWYGTVKPSSDTVKQGKGSQILVKEGWSTNARESREINGSKFTKNIKQLQRENEMKADAARPLAEFQAEFNASPDDVLKNAASTDTASAIMDELLEALDDKFDDLGLVSNE